MHAKIMKKGHYQAFYLLFKLEKVRRHETYKFYEPKKINYHGNIYELFIFNKKGKELIEIPKTFISLSLYA